MDFDRSMKGKVTESLVQTLLEHAGYRIVPLGVEHIIREVKESGSTSQGLPLGLRTLPDFLVTDATVNTHWLLEVKYRHRWQAQTIEELVVTLSEQVRQWELVYLLLFLGHSQGETDTPANQCRIFKLIHTDSNLHCLSRHHTQPTPWSQITWDDAFRVQDIFPALSATREAEGIRKCCDFIRNYTAVLMPPS